MRIKTIALTGLVGISIGVPWGIGTANKLEDVRTETIQREVQLLTDDWDSAYEYLGRDNSGKYGTDLSIEELKKLRNYINIQKDKTDSGQPRIENVLPYQVNKVRVNWS